MTDLCAWWPEINLQRASEGRALPLAFGFGLQASALFTEFVLLSSSPGVCHSLALVLVGRVHDPIHVGSFRLP